MKGVTPRERVLKAVSHKAPDRIPRGELLVEEAFLDRLYPEVKGACYREKMIRLMEEVGLDLVTVRIESDVLEEGLRELERWAAKTSYFVMALVDGLFWNTKDPLSFEAYMLGIYRGEERVRELIQGKKRRALRLIPRCLDHGADGFIIGDDLAYDRGPFVSPDDLRKWVFPGLEEMVEAIRAGNGVPFLHSCGNLTRIMDLILTAGFEGVHGLAPSSGNDPFIIQQMAETRLTLMGIIEVDRLGPREIKAFKEQIVGTLAAKGGYILGSAEGLSANTPLDAFGALY